MFLGLVQFEKCCWTFSLIVFRSVIIVTLLLSDFSIKRDIIIFFGYLLSKLLIIFFDWSWSCLNLVSVLFLMILLVSFLMRFDAIFLSVLQRLWSEVNHVVVVWSMIGKRWFGKGGVVMVSPIELSSSIFWRIYFLWLESWLGFIIQLL